MTNDKKLFYQGLTKSNNQVLLNKKYIVSALNKSAHETEVKMSTGEIFILNINYGDLTYQLLEVPHSSIESE